MREYDHMITEKCKLNNDLMNDGTGRSSLGKHEIRLNGLMMKITWKNFVS